MIELRNGRICDPTHPLNGQIASLFIQGDRFASSPAKPCEKVIQLDGSLVLAGGIDIHTHIGGGKVNLARLLMSKTLARQDKVVWPTTQTGLMYAKMGYTACFEPAMLLSSARHTHAELADTPALDHGAYVVLGNEDWLLPALNDVRCEDQVLETLIAWSMRASRAIAVKSVNPAGISAFKFNQRKLDVDLPHSQYGVSPRTVIRRLAGAIDNIGLAHPLHLHASNLGMPGNIDSTIASLEAVEGHRLHLTHAQFHCYTNTGKLGMGSGAERLARYINEHPNITLDVGQIHFGQTITISADTMAQYRNAQHANPNTPLIIDHECLAGCGVVPINYQDKHYVHSLQWTIGLELMLLVEDPWRIFLTTDHPNGGPFTAYPHLMRLLMDKAFRLSMLERIHPLAAANSLLRELDREYTLDEMVIVTRAAPARILGLHDLGTLRDGAQASLAVYPQRDDWETTFGQAAYVMKSGQIVVENNKLQNLEPSRQRWIAEPNFDQLIFRYWQSSIEQKLRIPVQQLEIGNEELDLLGLDSQKVNRLPERSHHA
ncbi:MAG: formylmethanofuran dehydrogenase subunit A [Pirellulales bacterium]